MEIKYNNSQIDFVQNEAQFLNSDNAEVVIVILDNTEVVYGADDSCNLDWCKENNISVVHHDKLRGGGCIASVKGNVFVDAKVKPGEDGKALADNFSVALCNFLKSKGLDSVRQDNNDVLVDDYKVASGAETSYNSWQYMGYQISINQDIELIKHACNKPMVKVPKGLGEYGITTEDIVDFCKSYWGSK